jgi:nitronate monooxygenase
VETSFTRLVGCRIPIQQAGMGITATSDLVAAVSDSGALGMLGAQVAPAQVVSKILDELGERTRGVFGINFLMPFLDRDSVASASPRARVVEFFYGEPDASLVSLVHEGGALVSWQVGSVEEAKAAVDVGADIVVAQGVEAGGHVRGVIGLLPLLELVLDAVQVPVLAAGGLGTARSVAAVIAAGAAGARVGTRFLAADEADVHPAYLEALTRARAEDAVLTTTFSNLWPDAPDSRSSTYEVGRPPHRSSPSCRPNSEDRRTPSQPSGATSCRDTILIVPWHGPDFLQVSPSPEYRSPSLGFTVFVILAGGASIALVTAVAVLTHHALIVPSLGPSAFLLFGRSQSAVSSPRNVLLGHLIGAVAGLAALACFGLLSSPAVTEGGLSASRIGAASLSISLTFGAMMLADVEHGPAAARRHRSPTTNHSTAGPLGAPTRRPCARGGRRERKRPPTARRSRFVAAMGIWSPENAAANTSYQDDIVYKWHCRTRHIRSSWPSGPLSDTSRDGASNKHTPWD